ncbi:MAG: ASCH domain-containing protein [Alphaproteobacteria bacterium]|nr:MAG: ASCH domain-containing protein [Alphaproteobacteria bacterium]
MKPDVPKWLSVRQPYAWLIGVGIKPVENRSWYTHYRGQLFIQATLAFARTPLEKIEKDHKVQIDRSALHRGGIVAVADLTDIVTAHRSKWFEGPFGWVFENPRLLPFVPMPGAQGIRDVPEEVLERIKHGDRKR